MPVNDFVLDLRFQVLFFEVWTYSAPAIAHADKGQSSNLRNIMSHHNSCCLYRNTVRQSWRGLLCISKIRFRPDSTWGFTGRLWSLFHACQLFPSFSYIVDLCGTDFAQVLEMDVAKKKKKKKKN